MKDAWLISSVTGGMGNSGIIVLSNNRPGSPLLDQDHFFAAANNLADQALAAAAELQTGTAKTWSASHEATALRERIARLEQSVATEERRRERCLAEIDRLAATRRVEELAEGDVKGLGARLTKIDAEIAAARQEAESADRNLRAVLGALKAATSEFSEASQADLHGIYLAAHRDISAKLDETMQSLAQQIKPLFEAYVAQRLALDYGLSEFNPARQSDLAAIEDGSRVQELQTKVAELERRVAAQGLLVSD
jgi:hypothetical protein